MYARGRECEELQKQIHEAKLGLQQHAEIKFDRRLLKKALEKPHEGTDMDYDQILPQLLVGSCPKSSDDIDKLRRETGITAVLNLQTDEDLRYCNFAWQPLQAHYTACGIELQRIPVRDFDPVDLQAKLPECARVLNQLLTAGHSVYVHCTAGAGRSPTVAIAYLIWCGGWELDEAVAYVTQRRPCSPNVDVIHLATRDLLMGQHAQKKTDCRANELFK